MEEAVALQHLKDALGANYAGPDDDATLSRALGVDKVGTVVRPWATAARLIAENTEYEVTDKLAARIDRKIRSLVQTQDREDARNGVLVPGDEDTFGSGAAPIRSVW